MRHFTGLEALCPKCGVLWQRLPWQQVCDSCGMEAMPAPDPPPYRWCAKHERFHPLFYKERRRSRA